MKQNILLRLMMGVLLLALFGITIPQSAEAQIRVGANYGYRNAKPKSGFGISLEPTAYSTKLYDIDVRGYYNSFSTSDSKTYSGESFDRKIEHYDSGIDLVGRYKLPFVDPYIAIGVGFSSYKITGRDYSQIKTSFLYNGSVGLEINPIPYVKPFVEYKYTKSAVDKAQILLFNPDNSIGQLEVGLNLKF